MQTNKHDTETIVRSMRRIETFYNEELEYATGEYRAALTLELECVKVALKQYANGEPVGSS